MIYIFINIFKVKDFFDDDIINYLKSAYQINILEIFLVNIVYLLKTLCFNN